MLKQARVDDLRKGRITKEDGYLVVATRHYPRGVKKDLFHKFEYCLAPTKELLAEFLDEVKKRDGDHNAGFLGMKYARKFRLSEKGWWKLREYAELSKRMDVYLICHCKSEDRCHRELLLLLAQRFVAADIDPPVNTFDDFTALQEGPPKSKA